MNKKAPKLMTENKDELEQRKRGIETIIVDLQRYSQNMTLDSHLVIFLGGSSDVDAPIEVKRLSQGFSTLELVGFLEEVKMKLLNQELHRKEDV